MAFEGCSLFLIWHETLSENVLQWLYMWNKSKNDVHYFICWQSQRINMTYYCGNNTVVKDITLNILIMIHFIMSWDLNCHRKMNEINALLKINILLKYIKIAILPWFTLCFKTLNLLYRSIIKLGNEVYFNFKI